MKLDFFKGTLAKPTFEEVVLDQFDDTVDGYVKSWLFDESGGFDALRKYANPAGTTDSLEKLSVDYMNNTWQLGNLVS